MNAITPGDPSDSHRPPRAPHETPEPQASPRSAQPAPPSQPPPQAPSAIGLSVAGAGLVLLCVSVMFPRVAVDHGEGDEYAFFGYSPLAGDGFGIDTTTVVLTVALLCAVGLSAHRNPALRWPTRLTAVGLAALTAAFSYHPVTVLQQSYEIFTVEGGAGEIDISADDGLYIAVVAVALLAASAFLMHRRSPRRVHHAPPPDGPEPTVTVTPGD